MTDERTPGAGVTVSDIYKEQYAHFRAMNDLLYKIPPLFTAVIGGLWYFAVQNLATDRWLSRAVFLFSTIACVCFVQVMKRFGLAFNAYIKNLNKLDGEYAVSIDSGLSTNRTIRILLWCAAAISLAAIAYSFGK